MLPKLRYLIPLFLPVLLHAQQSSELHLILDRLDRLEQENRDLTAEVHALREQLAGSKITAPAPEQAPPEQAVPDSKGEPPLSEQVEVNQRRIDELAQTKVEASQRMPISLTGMVLFNAFLNGRAAGGFEDPLAASPSGGHASGGATLAQSILGLTFQGPRVLDGGQVNGSIYFDLWGGTPTNSLNHLIRLRTATISIEWKNSSLMFGQDRPIVSPREPNSLAQVAFSPLATSGNLWLWSPQVRFEQRFAGNENWGVRAQTGAYETTEPSASLPAEYVSTLSTARPALEGRLELWGNISKSARVEIAPGFHVSETHVIGRAIPSRLFTIDWLIQPVSKVRLTGMFFQGENAAGLGGLRQGFTIFSDARSVAVPTAGGWAQLSFDATPRLTFNLYAGQESNSGADLLFSEITRNFTYALNAQYRLRSNVLMGWEASQVRTNYLGLPFRLNNHYDVALAYLF